VPGHPSSMGDLIDLAQAVHVAPDLLGIGRFHFVRVRLMRFLPPDIQGGIVVKRQVVGVSDGVSSDGEAGESPGPIEPSFGIVVSIIGSGSGSSGFFFASGSS